MTPRIVWLDIARTTALICMAIYHFGYDLAMFGIVPASSVISGPMRIFAICIAASFLALAGISLQVAHGTTFKRHDFLRRLGLLVAAAAAISLLTYIWVPESFIFFGILHAIALFSVLGLAFLRVGAQFKLIAALAVLALPFAWRHPIFDMPLLWWTGLGQQTLRTLDYEPVFPWFAAFLAGMAFAHFWRDTSLFTLRTPSRSAAILSWPGRHSLWVYLSHQPVLVGLLWLWLQIF